MGSAFSFLGRRRLTGVGVALTVEVAALVALAAVPQSAVAGLPPAVVAAVAGTVAVVFGPIDGLLVALAGAAVFGFADGFGPGEIAALAVWPAIVLAAGLVARGVSRQRRALEQIVAAQERERQQLALKLHDGTAQTLVAALLALKHADRAPDLSRSSGATAVSRGLIEEAIEAIRVLAVELRPKVLDDFGLTAALERLAAVESSRTGMRIEVAEPAPLERLPRDVELALYRIAQELLADAGGGRSTAARIALEQSADTTALVVEIEGPGADPGEAALEGLHARLRLLRGRLAVTVRPAGGKTIRAEVRRPRTIGRAAA
jgi:signal transduction histidine kinase